MLDQQTVSPEVGLEDGTGTVEGWEGAFEGALEGAVEGALEGTEGAREGEGAAGLREAAG